jgi:hypothetical protein
LATKEPELLERAARCDREIVVIGQFALPSYDVNRSPDLSFYARIHAWSLSDV